MLPLGLLLAVNLISDSPDATYRQPQMASRGDAIALTFGAGNAIYYTSSADHGATFVPPVKVAERGALALGRHRGPRVCYQSGNVVISAIAGEKGGGRDGDLLVWTSEDGAKWSAGVRVNKVEGSAREGLHGMECGNGWVVIAWLDLRAKHTQLYGAISTDGGLSWGKDFLIYESPEGSLCECCHPSVAIGPGGVIHVMFRNNVAGSRDMYLASSRDRGATWSTVRLGTGQWRINACPMDGGQLAVAPSGVPITTWRRESKVYVSKPNEEEFELGAGKDPTIASDMNNVVYAAWTGKEGIYLRTSEMNEAKLIGPGGAYGFLLFDSGHILVAWESGRGITVEKLR